MTRPRRAQMQPASDPMRRKACAGSVRGGALAAVQALAVIGGDEQSDAIMRDEWCGLAPPSPADSLLRTPGYCKRCS